ncbi:MAG: hypothetical protein V1736_07660 [Pseudomonadota bacterium]
MGALSVGDVRTGTIPSLLPSQKHYLKVYSKPFRGGRTCLREPDSKPDCSQASELSYYWPWYRAVIRSSRSGL